MKARFFALAALVLGLASCQNDFDGANVGVGGEVDFQLAVSAPEFGATRADNDGQNGYDSAFGAIDYLSEADWANVDLRYSLEVYDYDPVNKTIGNAPVKDRMVKVLDKYEPVVFELRLVPGRHYHFVVFADFVEEGSTETPTVEAQANIGKHHVIGATLADITLKNDAINTELTDAYFATDQFEITNSAAKDMILRRPYGKVRVVATDLAELNLNVEATSVKVTYTAPNANAFNAVYGTISGEGATTFTATYATCDKYTVGYDDDTTTALNGAVRKSHMTLSTDYILAVDEQKPIHFSIEVLDQNSQRIKETVFSTDIPVQRNYLTTVIGNVLTTGTEINISIDDNFYGEIENDMVLVNTAKELQEALDAYKNGQIILFDGNINGNVTVLQKEGLNVVIDGNDYKYDGVITVNGNARSKGAETLTFRNINFETAGSDFTFISAPSKVNNKYNYSHNVTVENCTFKGNHTVGCVSFTGTYNFVMRECEADNVHSIAQFQSCDNTILVEDITVTNSKSGLSFGNTAYPTLRNASIEAVGYGVRGDGDASRGNLVLENVDIDAFIPVVIRKVKTPGYTVNIDDESTLVAPGYHVVFTKGQDDAAFEAPAVDFTVNGADNLKVFPRDAATSGYVYNADELTEALANGENVVLADDIAVAKSEAGSNGYGATGISQLNGGVIDGQGNDISVDAWDTWDSAINTTGGTIKNLNVTGGMRGIFINHNSTNCSKVILDNVTIDGTVYTISCDQGTNNGLEATNSTFNGWTSYAATIGNVKFTNCSFGEGQGYAYCRPYAPTEFVNCDFATGYYIDAVAPVTFKDCTINGVALTVENINTLGSKSANMKLYHDGKYVSVASNTIENQTGVTYNGEFFVNPINDALYFNNWYMTGDATIKVVDKKYGAIILENVSGDINGDVIYIDNDDNSVMVLENCDFTLAEGKKLIKSVNTIYQVFMANITINGVELTNENAGQYLENVGWFQVVDEI